MLLLEIFQHSDGTFAWDAVLLILLALVAGYLFRGYSAKKTEQRKNNAALAELEAKNKKLDNEFKNYKSNINSSEKQNEKSVVQLGGRVKSLEGDIRVLSDEKNKLHQQLILKEEELKKYGRQVADLDDNLKSLLENKIKAETEAAEKLKLVKEELAKASAWEKRVRTAEEDAEKARAAIGNAERKKLEAELRLKTTTEYAGRVGPLELEVQTLRNKLTVMEADRNAESGTSSETLSALKTAMAQLELQKETNRTLQHEFEIKQEAGISLMGEIEYLRSTLSKVAAENEVLKSKITPADLQVTETLKTE